MALDFACGDEVYGNCTQLREYLEGQRQGYVLRVPSNFQVTLARGVGLTCAQAVTRLLDEAGAERSARPGPGPRASGGTPGRRSPPPPRGTTC